MDDFVFFQIAVQVTVGDFPRQVQRTQHQLTGFVPGVVGPMAEKQILPMEAADGPTDMVTQGAKAGSDHDGKLQKNRRAILPVKCRQDDAGKTPGQM
ncbi:hypothetical protein D3C78_1485610 [compost metagenome]